MENEELHSHDASTFGGVGTAADDGGVADGQPLFVDLPANGLFSRDWNAVRLTGRGREVEDGSFAARCRMDETVFIFR